MAFPVASRRSSMFPEGKEAYRIVESDLSSLYYSEDLLHVMLVSSGQRITSPPTEPVFSLYLTPMEFWFFAIVASVMLSWGTSFLAISSTAQILSSSIIDTLFSCLIL